MRNMKIILALIIVISLLNVSYAQRKRRSYSQDLFKRRLLELLLEADERGLFDESAHERKRHFKNELDDDLQRRSRKIFGYGDDILFGDDGDNFDNRPV